MKYCAILAFFLLGLSTAQSMNSFKYAGAWLENKNERKGVVEYLAQYGVQEQIAEKYQDGPVTMECIRLNENGFQINGIQPDGTPYNATMTWRVGERLPYTFLGMNLEFTTQIVARKAGDNVILFRAYKEGQSTTLFTTERSFTRQGDMKYTHTHTATQISASTIYKKWD